MKCPECNYNHPRGKEGMSCKKCRYRFIIDPQAHARFTDGKFLAILRRASRNGTYYFTEEELYFQACQRKKSGCVAFIPAVFFTPFASVSLMAVITYITGKEEYTWMEISLMGGLLAVVAILITYRLLNSPISRRKWDKMLQLWKKRHPELPYLLPGQSLAQPPAESQIPDLYEYGAPRLMICQEDIQVDWLIMNGFHSAHQAIIISESGYPHYLRPQVEAVIASNPALRVTLLHNTGTLGETMMERVIPDWQLSPEQVVDAGLSMETLKRMKVPDRIRKRFEPDFPMHALPYHTMQSLLSVCAREQHEEENNGSIAYAWSMSCESDYDVCSGGDGDFG